MNEEQICKLLGYLRRQNILHSLMPNITIAKNYLVGLDSENVVMWCSKKDTCNDFIEMKCYNHKGNYPNCYKK